MDHSIAHKRCEIMFNIFKKKYPEYECKLGYDKDVDMCFIAYVVDKEKKIAQSVGIYPNITWKKFETAIKASIAQTQNKDDVKCHICASLTNIDGIFCSECVHFMCLECLERLEHDLPLDCNIIRCPFCRSTLEVLA